MPEHETALPRSETASSDMTIFHTRAAKQSKLWRQVQPTMVPHAGLLICAAALLMCSAAAYTHSPHFCAQRLRRIKTHPPRPRPLRKLNAPAPKCTAHGFCGRFPDPSQNMDFASRLSPRCAALLETFRSPESAAGLSNVLPRDGANGCRPQDVAGARQPLVMASNTTATFVLCTAPKAGCTNIRKLLYSMLMHPGMPVQDALGQFLRPHTFRYPAIALYSESDVELGGLKAAVAAAAAADSTGRVFDRVLRRPARRLADNDDGVLWQPGAGAPTPMPGPGGTPATPPGLGRGEMPGPGGARASSPVPGLGPVGAPAPRPAPAPGPVPAPAPGLEDGDVDVPAPDGGDIEAAAGETTPVPPDVSIPDGHAPPPRLPAGVPSFTFGRNPYVRLLSGFRDKMVYNPQRRDQYTVQQVNAHLGEARRARWADTPAAFRTFVHALSARGLAGVDFHFQATTEVCADRIGLRFDFYLRLEEMAEWFPCWMDGLGLREWTETGWADTPHGRMFVGSDARQKFVTLNSYKHKKASIPVWNESRGAASFGERGVDWDLLSGDKCWWAPKGMTCEEYYASFVAADGSIVPGARARGGEGGGGAPPQAAPEQLSPQSSGRQRDAHDTNSQEAWELFYDQETADLAYLLYSRDFRAFGYEPSVIGR